MSGHLDIGRMLARPPAKPKTWVKCGAIWHSFRLLGALAGIALSASPGLAGDGGTKAAINHGVFLSATMTGPGAYPGRAGARRTFAGAAIRDGRAYAFASVVAAGAVYDGFPVAGPHLLVEDVDFTSPLDIFTHLPVVLRRVRVASNAMSHWGVLARPEAGPLYFLWSEAGGHMPAARPDRAGHKLSVGLHVASENSVVYRSHIAHVTDGIQIHAPGVRVIENVIDHIEHWPGDHNDGIQMLGRATGARIVRNRIMNRNRLVSCLNLIGDRVHVLGNYLAGGGYTLYGGRDRNGHGAGTTREVVVVDNIFGRDFFPKGGHFGPYTYWDARPGTGNVWRDNRFSDGTPLAGR